MSQEVWLGIAGDLVSPDTPADHYHTRLGGCPVFPGPRAPSCCSDLKCRVCGTSLSFILQAYAPLPQMPDRVILLLGCTAVGCGKSAGCWQAIRCQLPPRAVDEPQQQEFSPTASAASRQLQDAAAKASDTGFEAGTDWGFGPSQPDNGFDAGWGAPTASAGTDAFDFSDLTSSLTAAVQQQQQHQQQQQEKQKQQQQQKKQWHTEATPRADAAAASDDAGSSGMSAVAVVSSKGGAGPQLPEFYLCAELEPDGSSSGAIPSKELQHVQQLLAAYESAEAAIIPPATAGSSSFKAAPPSAAAAAAAESEGDVGASWAGEEYEPDSVSCMQRIYLKFMKRVARKPQQCARYSHNGLLLWPQNQVPKPSPCQHCGSCRVFELQLMPALSQMVLEAAEMMQEQGLAADAAVVNSVANWDWCTVAVFTCEASCSSNKAGMKTIVDECDVAYEEVVLVSEAECESQAGSSQVAAGAVPSPAAGVAGSIVDHKEK